jgi:DNA-binding winged helix-turn-helix (wHTH) protein/tetratricopeptide (TPR) repeat protein
MKPKSASPPTPFRLDNTNQILWHGAQAIPLTPKAFTVLRYLMARPGQLVTKEELLNAAWPGIYVSDAALKVCIRRIRQALGDLSHPPQYIETVYWRGYRFIGSIELSESSAVRSPQSAVRGPGSAANSQTPGVSSQYSLASSSQSGGVLPQQLTTDSWQPATRVVGREAELAQLHGWLGKALQGERQVIFVTGEPGIGKTMIAEAFLARAAVDKSVWITRGQCIEHYGAGEPYLPMLDALERLCRTHGRERLIALLKQQAPMWLAQMPSLITPAERKKLRRDVQGASRERMLRTVAEVLETLTAETPLILALEDLHWSDYATLDLLSFLARRREAARLLLIGTYRPREIIVGGHPLKVIKHELQVHGQCAELPLGLLTAEDVAAYLLARFTVDVADQSPWRELARVVHQRTDGNPLFMVNVVDYLVTQGLLVPRDGGWHLQGSLGEMQIEVPASIQQMIETQIDRLSPEEQHVLEVASVAGVEFSAATVAAGLPAEVMEVEELCEGLARRAQFLRPRGVSEWPDGTVAAHYQFIHSLYQQVWYGRVTAGRRLHLHRRIGECEEAAYGPRAGEVAAELAVHFECGRDYGRAVHYRQRAAKNALRRCAYREATGHLDKGLELLKAVPDTPERLQQEISLQISLGLSLVATKGYAAPEVERSYTRALELCRRQVEATPQLAWALLGLQGFYYVRAELQTARALGEQVFALVQDLQDPGLLGIAHSVLGATLSSLGEPLLARTHLERGIALSDSQKHARYRALSLSFAARVLWTLGYPDQAWQRNQEALALARELAHPLTSVITSCVAALLHIAHGEVHAAQQRAEEAMALAVEQGFFHWEAQAIALRGWALAQQGRGEESVAQVRRGLDAYQETGARLAQPLLLGLLAETHRNTGRPQEGLSVAAEALAVARLTGQSSQEAWLCRLRGELLLQAGVPSPKSKVKESPESRQGKTSQDQSGVRGPGSGVPNPQPLTPNTPPLTPITHGEAETEACFLQALDLARRQGAKSLELRAALSLGRLWQRQGKKEEARRSLAEIYNWFTEGFDTPHLKDARALLQELGD